ncbi:MAG: cytochrome b5 domain-containing protein, partial [Candidatus Diapherotrites archaeon]|nr:cytochrome b5 domain-containing protein [Candidatus Diapherotrites archaeon]
NTREDCWMVMENKVYEMSFFIDMHPGGEAITEGCGKDATSLFETRPSGSGTPHSADARGMREMFYLGDLE